MTTSTALAMPSLRLFLLKLGIETSLRTLERCLLQRCFGQDKFNYVIKQDKPHFGDHDIGAPLLSGVDADPTGAVLPYVPLSSAGLAVRDEVRRRSLTGPVGADRHHNLILLTQYRPNVDFYLDLESREQLRLLGRSPFESSPAGAHADYLRMLLITDFAWASARLEGNTTTRLETHRFIAHGQTPPDKPIEEMQMILNHQIAFNFLIEEIKAHPLAHLRNAHNSRIGMNRYTLFNLHAILTHNVNNTRTPHERRDIQAHITLFLKKAAEIADPFEQSFFCLLHLPYVRPFSEGNRRVSRLMANVPLIQRNLCPLTFIDISEQAYLEAQQGVALCHRTELLRDVFMWAYERAARRYLAREPMMLLHLLMFKYRTAVMLCVQAIVLHNLPGTVADIERFAANTVDPENNEAFVQVVQNELGDLYIGNIARYRLQLNEFEHWQWKRNARTLETI